MKYLGLEPVNKLNTTMLEAWIEHLSGALNELKTNLETERLDMIITLLGGDKNTLKTNLVSEKITMIVNLMTGEQKANATLDDLIAVFNEQAKAEVTGTSITVNDSANLPASLEITDNVGGTAYIKVCNKNLFSRLVKYVGIDHFTGAEKNDKNGSATEFIKINNNFEYIVSGLTDSIRSFVGAYNENKEFLGRTGGSNQNSISFGKNSFTSGTAQGTGDVEYIRISQYALGIDVGTIDDIDGLKIQLEEGTIATNYVPHQEQNYEIQAEAGNKIKIKTYYPTTHITSIGSVQPTMKLNYKKVIE